MANNYKLEVVKHGSMYSPNEHVVINCPECERIATAITRENLQKVLAGPGPEHNGERYIISVTCPTCHCQFTVVPDKPN